MQASERRYDSLSIALHWIIGIGIIVLAGTELVRDELPKGSLIREGLKPLHAPLGTFLFVLILLRIGYRLVARRTASSEDSGVADKAASLVHLGLYVLMLAVPLLGLIAVLGSDKAIDFGLFKLEMPLKSYIGSFARGAREVHEALGIGILLLAGLHAAAALAHHYLLRDGVLRQMLPRWLAASKEPSAR